jgi:hypothetical protein
MENERWEQVKTLCLGALEREESARPLYLQQVCGDDEELRRELESRSASLNAVMSSVVNYCSFAYSVSACRNEDFGHFDRCFCTSGQ